MADRMRVKDAKKLLGIQQRSSPGLVGAKTATGDIEVYQVDQVYQVDHWQRTLTYLRSFGKHVATLNPGAKSWWILRGDTWMRTDLNVGDFCTEIIPHGSEEG